MFNKESYGFHFSFPKLAGSSQNDEKTRLPLLEGMGVQVELDIKIAMLNRCRTAQTRGRNATFFSTFIR